MRTSLRIGQLAGIDIKVHVSFALVLAFAAVHGARAAGAPGAAFALLLVGLLFGCVVLHELGHALAARHFGIRTQDIVLWPLGGVARLTRRLASPREELLVAAAGPAVNVGLALLLATALLLTGGVDALAARGAGRSLLAEPGLASTLLWLLAANVTMALFNLLPAFPLDGGRMLRAGLALRLSEARATALATGVGQVAALALVGLAVWRGDVLLALVGGFIFLGASAERADGAARGAVAHLRVEDAYARGLVTLAPRDSLRFAAETLLRTAQQDFPVLLGDRLLGVVTRAGLLAGLRTHAPEAYVAGVMQREVPTVEPHLTLVQARDALEQHGVRVLAVVRGEDFLGLLSFEDLQEAAAVGHALPTLRPVPAARSGAV